MMYVMTAILLVYLCYTVWVSTGIPVSLSATYYMLGDRGWLFQTVLSVVGIGIYYPWSMATPDGLRSLPFLVCGNLLFVALAPQFRLRLDGIVHYSSAIACGVLAALWLVLTGHTTVLLSCLLLSTSPILGQPDKYMWWIECAVMAALMSVLTFNL